MWFAKKFSKPCVMTIYNWRRKGLHPRLWAWKWAVSKAHRKWYISEFVWNSWEYKRKWNSARLPVISRMPKEECEPHKRKGFLYVGRWIPNKGIRILIEAYRLSSPNPSEWPLTMLGDGPLKAEVEERRQTPASAAFKGFQRLRVSRLLLLFNRAARSPPGRVRKCRGAMG